MSTVRTHNPYAQATAAIAHVPTAPSSAVHAELAMCCRAVQMPNIDRMPDRVIPRKLKMLFIGQVRAEVTAPQLRWLIRELCGVSAIDVKARGLGSFVVLLQNDNEQVLRVRMLHKRIVFDLDNICWYANDEDSVNSIYAYQQNGVMASKSRPMRLPTDSIVVEETRTSIRQLRMRRANPPVAKAPKVVAPLVESPLHSASLCALSDSGSTHSDGDSSNGPSRCETPLLAPHSATAAAAAPAFTGLPPVYSQAPPAYGQYCC